MGFVDVRDVAEAMVVGLEKGEIGQKYFLGGHNLTFRQFYEVLGQVGGKPVPKTVIPHWLLYILCVIGEPLTDGAVLSRSFYGLMTRYWWYDNSKAERDLGWTFRPLEETVRDSINWLKQEGHL
jgi:dihydroflavonol-4-reductase